MKAPRWSYCCAFALASLPSLASADEPFSWAKNRVDEAIVKPVSARERSGGFSRGRTPPRQSRIRITQPSESRDTSNRAFVAFAIDVRWGSSDWNKDDVVGCVYREGGKVFVKIGDGYRPAAILLGKDVEPVAGVCVAAPPPPPPSQPPARS